MKIIFRPRQSGKTQELIKESSKEWSYIVCHSREEAKRISRIAMEMSLNIPFPITFDEFLGHKYHSKGIKSFLIDNVEWILEQLTDIPIRTITMSDLEN